MKKLISALCLIAMLLCLFAPMGAMADAASKDQVTKPSGIIYYDAKGQQVNGATALGDDGAIVSVKKSAAQHTDASGKPIENQFLVELQVRTTQELLELSSGSPDAAVTLILDVSSSMTECINCGHRLTDTFWYNGRSYNCHDSNAPAGRGCAKGYTSRISQTISAANAFLEDFAKMGIEEDETDPPRRMVSIITFDMDAEVHQVRNQTYIDVSNATNLSAAKAVISGLQTASGTNVEGGLRLARNIMTQGRQTGGSIAGIDYLYTVLLTDGEPSACIYPETNANRNSTTKIEGDWDNDGDRNPDYSTNWEDVNEVVQEVTNIKNFSSQSRFYSICLGYEDPHGSGTSNTTLQMKPFSDWADLGLTDDTTVETWLKSFSHAVFGTYATADDITGNFDSVMSQIELAAQAWRVEDQMGPDVNYIARVPVTHNNQTINNSFSFDQDTETLEWNLLQSNTDPSISSASTQNPILGYTFRYIVELDNLKDGYSHTGEHATNTTATLDYAVKNNNVWEVTPETTGKEFFEPQVESYTGTLTFYKVDEKGQPIKGMNFTLKTDDKTGWVMQADGPSNDAGKVTFTGIPSGHEYRLDEETMTGFAPVGDVEFSVEWAQTIIPADSLLKSENGMLKLTNNTIEHEGNPIDLTLEKVFRLGPQNSSVPMPAEALADITKSYAHFNLTYPGQGNPVEQIYLNGGKLSNNFEGLDEGTHTISELSAPIEGYALIDTVIEGTDSLGNTVFSIDNAAKSISFDADRDPSQARDYTVTYTNHYRQMTGSIAVRKAFEEHSLLTHTCDPNAAAFAGNASGVTAIVSLYRASDMSLYDSIELNAENNWTEAFYDVPVGDYVIRETSVTGDVSDYDFVHGRFVSLVKNNQSTALDLDAEKNTYHFTVADGDRYGFNLENHYEREHGSLTVYKRIAIDDNPDNGATTDAERFVQLYQQQNNGAEPQITVKVYAGATAAGNPVETLVLNAANGWQHATGALPIGAYTVVEDAPPALNGYALEPAASSTVTITADHHTTPAQTVFTNTYTRKTGALEIIKQFKDNRIPNALLDKTIEVQVVRTSDRAIVARAYLNAANGWKDTVDHVPFDAYELIEVITSTEQNSAYVSGLSLVAQWSYPDGTTTNAAFVTQDNWEQANGATISRVVTNIYSDNVHDLTLKKTFSSASAFTAETIPDDYYISVDMARVLVDEDGDLILDANGDPIVDTSYELGRLALRKNLGFTTTARLPSGSYLLSETVYNAPEGYSNTATFTLTPNAANDHIHFNAEKGVLTVEDHVGDHSALTLTIENTYTAKPASLTVRKSFAGQLAWDLFETRQFSISLYEKGGQLVETKTISKHDTSDNPLDSFVCTFENLSSDKEYYLVEGNYDLPNYTDSVHWQMGSQSLTVAGSAQSQPFTVNPGSSVTAVVTNTYHRAPGGVTAQKTYSFTGEAADAAAIAASTVTLTFTPKDGGLIGQTASFTMPLTGTTPTTITNVPAGTYIVTESNANNLTDYTHTGVTFKVGNTTSTGSAEVVIPEGANATVTLDVTNNYSRNTAEINLSKTFSGDILKSYVDSVTFSIKDQGGNQAAVVRVNEGNGWKNTATLPTGTYTITETVTLKANAPYPLTNYTHTPIWTSTGTVSSMTDNADGSVTVALANGANADIAVAIENTYDFVSGTITVSKDVAGVLTEGDLADKAFTVEIYNASNELQETLILNTANSFKATSKELPSNQYYYLVETGDLSVDGHSVSTQWLFSNGGAFSDATNPAKSRSFLLQTNANAAFTVRNTYALSEAKVALTKLFTGDLAADHVESVVFTISDPANTAITVTAPSWSGEAELPIGDYTVTETVNLKADAPFALTAYNHTATWTQTSTGTSKLTGVSADGISALFSLANDDVAGLALSVKNDYQLKTAGVTIVKKFSGYTAADMPTNLTFTLTNKADPQQVFTFALPNENQLWTATNAAIPEGEYLLAEQITSPDQARVTPSFTASPVDALSIDDAGAVSVKVTPGASITIECTNRLDKMFTVRLPIHKNIVQGGALPPASQLQFRFMVNATIPAGVNVAFGAESGGVITNVDQATGAIDVLMEDSTAFKGFIEFTGFGDQLAGVKGTVTEALYPYLNTEEAEKAGWTYDSASYAFSLEGSTFDAVRTSLTSDGKPAGAVAFSNTFTQDMPVIPQTGDNSSMLLWLLALAGSAMTVALLRKRSVSNN